MSSSAADLAGGPVSLSLDDLPEADRVLVLAKAFNALGDPVRMRIVELLRRHGEQTVGELTAALPVSQPRVSVHLGCLSDCGFATGRREGRRVYYRLAGPHVAMLVDAMRAHAESALPGLLACAGCAVPGAEQAVDGSTCC